MDSNTTINIALCWNDTDGQYSKFALTTIVSILEHNRNNKLAFFIIMDIPAESNAITIVQDTIQEYKQECTIVKPSQNIKIKEIINFFNMHNSSTFDVGAYYRLLLPMVLPSYVNKIIYLDCDIIVNTSLSKLWDIDFEGKCIIGVKDKYKPKYSSNSYDYGKAYINSGVLMLNVDKIRNLDFINLVKDSLIKLNDQIPNADQDVINAIFAYEKKIIPKSYNYLITLTNKDKYSDAYIYHYLKPKVFNYNPCFMHKKYIQQYYKYLDLTPYKGWRPKRDIINSIRYGTLSGYKTNSYLRKIAVRLGLKDRSL